MLLASLKPVLEQTAGVLRVLRDLGGRVEKRRRKRYPLSRPRTSALAPGVGEHQGEHVLRHAMGVQSTMGSGDGVRSSDPGERGPSQCGMFGALHIRAVMGNDHAGRPQRGRAAGASRGKMVVAFRFHGASAHR